MNKSRISVITTRCEMAIVINSQSPLALQVVVGGTVK